MACDRKGGGAGAPVDLIAVLGIDIMDGISGRLTSIQSKKCKIKPEGVSWKTEGAGTYK
jgi:hypothetical protein